MSIEIKPMTREMVRLRAALVGPTGSGKTLGALRLARAVLGSDEFVVFDTEHGRAKLYGVTERTHTGMPDRFACSHANLYDTRPEGYIEALHTAENNGFKLAVFDSVSPEWLNILTEADRFSNWKDLTPRHNAFVQAIAASPIHVIVTMRAKMKYEITEVMLPGRTKPKQNVEKIGLGPIQRDGIEYEFDVLCYLDTEHDAQFSNRGPLVGQTVPFDDDAINAIVIWLNEGEGQAELPPAEPPLIGVNQSTPGQPQRRHVNPTAQQRQKFSELLEQLAQAAPGRDFLAERIEPWTQQAFSKGIDELDRREYDRLLLKIDGLLEVARQKAAEDVPFSAPTNEQDVTRAADELGMPAANGGEPSDEELDRAQALAAESQDDEADLLADEVFQAPPE